MVCRSTSAVGPFVDKAGTSCRSGGGTKVLESHDWVYGPGGQGVYQDPTYGPVSSVPPFEEPLGYSILPIVTYVLGSVLPLRRYSHRLQRWAEEVRLE